ncbi:MAG: hypothetical protein IH587_10665 [Anaerolineae bacterium]|nr:hypothetical protein [Anaerolineae bacterium]
MFENHYIQSVYSRQHRQELLNGVERDRLAQIALGARSGKRRWLQLSMPTLRATLRAWQKQIAPAESAPDLCCPAAACC